MSKEEILENNKLIAEFMGFDFFKSIRYTTKTFDSTLKYLQYFKFHQSWDWLIPVVSKIDNIYKDLYKDAYANKIPVSYEIETSFADVICRNITTELNHLYERVIEFIKWYNQNKIK